MFLDSYKSQSTQNESMNSYINGMDNLFKTIYNIESQDNFSFLVDDIEVKCNRLFVSFISPSISKNFQTDRTMDSFTFHVDDFVEIIESYYTIILNKRLDSTSENEENISKKEIKRKIKEKLIEIIHKTIQLKIEYYFSTQNQEETSIIDYLILLKIFKNLGNENFVQKLNDNLNQYLQLINMNESPVDNEEEIVKRIQTKEKLGIGYPEEIKYIKKHFCEMNTDMLNEINQSIIKAAITQKDFQVPDEDSFLYQILEMKSKHRMLLLPLVQFPNLSVTAINFFLNEVDFNEVNKNLWNSVTARLLYPITEQINPKRYSEPKQFLYSKGHEYDGIINFLNKKCGGNSHLKGLIEITSSGEKLNHCYNLIDSNFDSFFSTNAGYDSYIQFDFKDIRISIKNYLLKTIGVPTAKCITWAVCGSNNLKNWKTLSNIHTNAWPGYNNASVVSVTDQDFYRYIRIKLTGLNAAGGLDLNLSGVEFFGLMKPCKRNKYNQI